MKKIIVFSVLMLCVIAKAFAGIAPNQFIVVDVHPFSFNISADYHLLFSVKDDVKLESVTDSDSDNQSASAPNQSEQLESPQGAYSAGVPFGLWSLPSQPPDKRYAKNYLGIKLGFGAGIVRSISQGWYFKAGVVDRLRINSAFCLMLSVYFVSSLRWYLMRFDFMGAYKIADNLRVTYGASIPVMARHWYSEEEDSNASDLLALFFTSMLDMFSVGLEIEL